MSLKRMSNKANRLLVDHSKVRMIVHIHIQHLILPENIGEFLQNGTLISVCLERGGKMSSSPNKVFDLSEHDPISINRLLYTIDETVELVATLYQDNKTKTFQEKLGKIILRETKPSGSNEPNQRESKRAAAYKRLGSQGIDLAHLAPTSGQTRVTEQLLPIELSPATGDSAATVTSLKATITTCFIRSSKMSDDAMSIISDDDDDMASVSSETGHVVWSTGLTSSQDSVCYQDYEGTDLTKRILPERLSNEATLSVSSLAIQIVDHGTAGTADGLNSTGLTSGTSGGSVTSRTELYDQLSPYSESHDNYSPNIEDTLSARSRQSVGRNLTRVQANKEAFQLYISEIENQKGKIASLEKELTDKGEQHKTQLLQLHTEKNLLQTSLDREKVLRKANATSVESADTSKLLQKAREETADYAAKFGRASAELHVMREEMEYCRMLADFLCVR
jgi:hypothetical protein